jgi:cysteine sulfinate desulfinase/cysteine desulfurase-like protein
MGLTPELAMSAVRLSLSKYSTDEEVDHLLAKMPEIVAKLRGTVPQTPTPKQQKIEQ